jgi:hypothetical protein
MKENYKIKIKLKSYEPGLILCFREPNKDLKITLFGWN